MATKKVTKEISDLDKEFAALSLKGIQADEAYAEAEHAIYGTIVNTYLFHRKVREQKEFLKRKYEEAGVRENELDGNQINFRPFIRIMFRLDIPNITPEELKRKRTTTGTERTRIAQYKIIFTALEEEFSNNADNYQSNPFPKLLQFLTDKTMKGLVTEYKDKQVAKKSKGTLEGEKEVEDTKKALADVIFTTITEQQTVLASATIQNPDDIQYNAENLSACLCRFNETTNKFEIIATSKDELAMRLIAESNTPKIDYIKTPALRTLAEIVSTQSFPSKHIPGGNRDKLTGALKSWYNSVYLEDSTEKKEFQTNRRLVLRGTDILLSAQRTDSSVVTILKEPIFKLIPATAKAVYLKTEMLRMIEEWIENRTIAARTSQPDKKLEKPSGGTSAEYILTVNNTITNSKSRKLFFYDINNRAESFGQVDFNESAYKPAWKVKVKNSWVTSLRSCLLDPWFELAASGRKLKRAENSIFEIKVTPTQFKVSYEIDGSSTPPSETFPFSRAPTFQVGKSATFTVKTKDAAPVLNNIADLTINGDIELSGNKSVFVIKFATDLGKYIIAIPTLTGKNLIRDKTQFQVYARRDKATTNDK